MEDVQYTSYEMMIIFTPDLGEEKTKKEIQELKDLITSHTGKIIQEDIWGVKDFAYVIKKYEQGYYAVFNFEMDPAEISALEKPLNLNQNVIRYLVIKAPKNYQFKTLDDFAAEAAKAAKEKAEKEQKEEAKKPQVRKPAPKPVRDVRPEKIEKVEKPKAEKKVEKKAKQEDLDEKLKNIINDPDITL